MTDKSIYNDAPDYCHYFFDLVQSNDLIAELHKNKQSTLDIILSIPKVKENYAYAENKWTIKEVLRHIIDSERVYSYRALRFSRFDNTELAGFDENEYIEKVKNIKYNLNDLLIEYSNVRDASINLYRFLTDEMLDFKGVANKVNFTARTIGFMTVGHNIHHCNFIRTKYFNDK